MPVIQNQRVIAKISLKAQESNDNFEIIDPSERFLVYKKREGKLEIIYNQEFGNMSGIAKFYSLFTVFEE